MPHAITHARRAGLTWALLAALTLAGMAAARLGMFGAAVNAVVLTLAVIKARAVLWNFLDLRSASSGWRAVFLVWLILIAGTAWLTAAAAVLLRT